MNAHMQMKHDLLRDLSDKHQTPPAEDECSIFGVPVRDIPDDLLRGLLRWALRTHMSAQEQHMHQLKTLRTLREAAR